MPVIRSGMLIVGRADKSGSMSPTTTVFALSFAFLLLSSTSLPACSSVMKKKNRTYSIYFDLGHSQMCRPQGVLRYTCISDRDVRSPFLGLKFAI